MSSPTTAKAVQQQQQQQQSSGSSNSNGDQKQPMSPRSEEPVMQVHPMAQALADLLSPMSIIDQERSYVIGRNLIYGSIAFGFPLGYAFNSLSFLYYSILGSAFIAFIATVPNWFQRPDPLRQWASKSAVDSFYVAIEEAHAQRVREDDEETESEEESQSESTPTTATPGDAEQQGK